jgi:OmpA-OmpF porin, OOP family
MKKIFGAAALGALLVTAAAPHAKAEGFAVNRFDPSERGSDFFVLDSLDLRGHVRPAVGAVAEWGYRPLVLYDPSGAVKASVVRNQVVVHPGASMVFWDRVRVGLDVPVQVFADGHGGSLNGVRYDGATSDPVMGDLRLSADVRLLGAYREAAQVAFGAQLWAPTGDKGAYSGDGSVRFMPRVLFAGGVAAFQYAAKVGFTYRARDDAFGGSSLGSELVLGAGAGIRAADDKLLFSVEVLGSTTLDDPFKTRSSPLEGTFGIHYLLPADLRVGAGIGSGLARGYGTPAVRGLLGFEYAPQGKVTAAGRPDRDKDGIPDEVDACPETPGERTNDPHTNGCPKGTDRDKDGILDDEDACPNAPGVASDDPRANGCPLDTDGDGIIDSVDACPTVPGVEQANPKKTGCPPDSDDDGIIDEDDACPDVPGPKSDNPKINGCPIDLDRDKDGIPNDVDACPDEAGKADPDPKRNGCPKAFVQGGQIKILDQVKFKTGSAAIEAGRDSEEVLEAVLKVLQDHREITQVRVEGHTDNKGNAKANKKLSADRAASVVRWLFAHGIGAGRVTSAGFGSEKPLESNATEEGRKNNRRVEFHIAETTPPATGATPTSTPTPAPTPKRL